MTLAAEHKPVIEIQYVKERKIKPLEREKTQCYIRVCFLGTNLFSKSAFSGCFSILSKPSQCLLIKDQTKINWVTEIEGELINKLLKREEKENPP